MYSWDFEFLVCDCFLWIFLDGEWFPGGQCVPLPAMSSRWDWMLGIIFMVAISVIVIVSTFACIVFCKCKRKLKQAKTVGIAPTEQDEESGEAGARPRDLADLASSRTNAPNMKSLVASFVRIFSSNSITLLAQMSMRKSKWVSNVIVISPKIHHIPITHQEMTTWLIDSKLFNVLFLKIFHSHGDVTTVCEGLCATITAFDQEGQGSLSCNKCCFAEAHFMRSYSEDSHI